MTRRPPQWQLNNFRPTQKHVREKLVADLVGRLQKFLQSPPEDINIRHGAVCTSETIRICFLQEASRSWLEDCELTSFCMGFAFGIGSQSLALGGCGALGLRPEGNQGPHVRFVPFMVGQTEDHDAHKELFRQYMDVMKRRNVPVTDGYADCFCYNCLKSALEDISRPTVPNHGSFSYPIDRFSQNSIFSRKSQILTNSTFPGTFF